MGVINSDVKKSSFTITTKLNSDVKSVTTPNDFQVGYKKGVGNLYVNGRIDLYEYGGIVLGCTHLNPEAVIEYALTTSYVVGVSDWKVTFVAPRSGNVELEVQIYFATAGAGNSFLYFGLSDSSTYNSLGEKYENQVWEADEDDNATVKHSWVVTGLAPGVEYTYYLGAKYVTTIGYLQYGGTETEGPERPAFVFKAISLPNNLYLGSGSLGITG